MAGIKATGIEGLALSMQEVAEIPDEIIADMLEAGGAVVVESHRRQLAAFGLIKTGILKGSISALSKQGDSKNNWRRSLVVYPKGTHHKVNRRQTDGTNKRGSKGKTVPAGEVGFIHEYGAPKRRIKGKKWMQKANEGAADAVAAAEMEVYDRWLTSKEL